MSLHERVDVCAEVAAAQAQPTPGPWRVPVADVDGHDGDCVVVSESRRMICECYEDGEVQTDEDRANARLVAAAPELLAALVSLKRVAENALGSEMHSGDRAVLMNADAAIRKALGK
jgi:hypothetical protein